CGEGSIDDLPLTVEATHFECGLERWLRADADSPYAVFVRSHGAILVLMRDIVRRRRCHEPEKGSDFRGILRHESAENATDTRENDVVGGMRSAVGHDKRMGERSNGQMSSNEMSCCFHRRAS